MRAGNVAIIATLLAATWVAASTLPMPDQIERDLTGAKRPASGPAVISGPPHVLDGDTIRVGAVTVRLEGIDAPEGGQECWTNGSAYDCGATATQALDAMITQPTVTCLVTGRDKYRRLLGECWASDADRGAGRPSLNSEMVRAGHAIAYRFFSTAYVAQEDEARLNSRGIWAGHFIEPYKWRAEHRATRDAPALRGAQQ